MRERGHTVGRVVRQRRRHVCATAVGCAADRRHAAGRVVRQAHHRHRAAANASRNRCQPLGTVITVRRHARRAQAVGHAR